MLTNTIVKIGLMGLFMYMCTSFLFGGLTGGTQDLSVNMTSYMTAFKEMMEDKRETMMPRLGAMSEVMDREMDEAMRLLFTELDTNNDGAIQYEEFTGMTLKAWAAFRSFDVALRAFDVPMFSKIRATMRDVFTNAVPSVAFLSDELGEADSYWDAFKTCVGWYILFLIYIQCALCAWENVLAFLGLKAFNYKTAPDVTKVPHVEKARALQYPTPLGSYEQIKMVLMTISLLPLLRLVQTGVFVCAGMISVNIAVMVPNELWKNFWLRGITQLCISGSLFSLGYYRVGVTGAVAGKERCKILVGNHMAMVEILVLFGLSFPSFISAVENTRVPLFSGVVRACNAILVNREDKRSRQKTLNEIKRRCEDPTAPQLMIFPEGTLDNQEALFQFKAGAFEPGQPVQPVCFKFPFTNYCPAWTGEAAGGNDIGDCVWRGVCQIVNRLEVKVLPVYHPSEAEKQDKYLYARNVRQLMAAHMSIGVCDCTYEDYLVLNKYHDMKQRQQQQHGRKPPAWNPFGRRLPVDVRAVLERAHDDSQESAGYSGGENDRTTPPPKKRNSDSTQCTN